MGFTEAVQTVFSKYATFDGRSVRSEYWWWVLFVICVSIVLNLAQVTISHSIFALSVLWSLGTIIPGIAVGVRRLHDIDRSGWWWLIVFVPVVGVLLLIYWACQPGTQGGNRYG